MFRSYCFYCLCLLCWKENGGPLFPLLRSLVVADGAGLRNSGRVTATSLRNGFDITRQFETNGSSSTSDNNGKAIGKNKNAAADDCNSKVKNVTDDAKNIISEIDSGRWGNGVCELGFDEENQSSYSLDSQAKTPSFARRTLLWLAGRQNKWEALPLLLIEIGVNQPYSLPQGQDYEKEKLNERN